MGAAEDICNDGSQFSFDLEKEMNPAPAVGNADLHGSDPVFIPVI
jgi:hypothetical protein